VDKYRKDSGFTLIELLVAITILGVVTGTTLIRYDFFSTGSSQAFRQIVSFLRLQHARTLQSSSIVTLRINANENRIDVIQNEETIDRLLLDRWTIIEPSGRFSIRLSPWSYERQRLTLQNSQDQERVLRTDWSLGFVEQQ
jgi:prepilin-type N-terminal cleavage/methylation domain-containing protein